MRNISENLPKECSVCGAKPALWLNNKGFCKGHKAEFEKLEREFDSKISYSASKGSLELKRPSRKLKQTFK